MKYAYHVLVSTVDNKLLVNWLREYAGRQSDRKNGSKISRAEMESFGSSGTD